VNPHADPDQDPLSVTEVEELICPGPSYSYDFKNRSYGKWMVFKDFSELSDTWRALREVVRSGYLSAMGAKCSTLNYNPLRRGAGPTTTGTISIYTGENNVMDVGEKLIRLPSVRQNIKYKTVSATRAVRYSHMTGRSVAKMTLYWNGGNPTTDRSEVRGPYKRNPRKKYDSSKDSWKINVVNGPSQYESKKIHGKWTISSNFEKTSRVNILKAWLTFKPKIEGGDIPAVKMTCPGPTRLPKIHVFTSEDDMDAVGKKIISWFQNDITYYVEVGGRSRRNDNKKLYWNAGNPGYVKA
jgi:hypothetical protein